MQPFKNKGGWASVIDAYANSLFLNKKGASVIDSYATYSFVGQISD